MKVLNVHEREYDAPVELLGNLIGSLGRAGDRLWPAGKWPPMRLDRPLSVGARGGHGPIRYAVEQFQPGRSVVFRFSAPRGFDGTHTFDVRERNGHAVLRHAIEMRTRGAAAVRWALALRPMHDALLEDCLDKAALSLGRPVSNPARWPISVRMLQAVFTVLRRFGVR
jgi:hypothetical protein